MLTDFSTVSCPCPRTIVTAAAQIWHLSYGLRLIRPGCLAWATSGSLCRFELIATENAAALGHDLLKIGKRAEVAVGERLIQNRPEVLGGLKLGRVAGQVDEPDPIRNSQVRCGVPAGVVEPEHDDALSSRPGLARNSASSAAKNGFEMPFDIDQKVSPEIGWTKAVTYNHL